MTNPTCRHPIDTAHRFDRQPTRPISPAKPTHTSPSPPVMTYRFVQTRSRGPHGASSAVTSRPSGKVSVEYFPYH
eukprot:2991182-Prymnesium_polylepis.2